MTQVTPRARRDGDTEANTLWRIALADGPPPFDWNKLFSKENQPKAIVGIVGLLALVVVLRMATAVPSQPAQGNDAAPRSGVLSGLFGVGVGPGAEAVPLQPLQAGQCRSFAPAGWSVIDTNPNGTVFTAATGDRFSSRTAVDRLETTYRALATR